MHAPGVGFKVVGIGEPLLRYLVAGRDNVSKRGYEPFDLTFVEPAFLVKAQPPVLIAARWDGACEPDPANAEEGDPDRQSESRRENTGRRGSRATPGSTPSKTPSLLTPPCVSVTKTALDIPVFAVSESEHEEEQPNGL